MSMTKKHSFKYEELIDCANGKLFGPGNAKLPLPPMLMFDRIINIPEMKGKFSKGLVEAELDIKKILKKSGAVVGLADGKLYSYNKAIYQAEGLKVGLFKS